MDKVDAISKSSPKYTVENKAIKKYYIRLTAHDKLGVLGRIASLFGKNGVSLSSVVQRQKNGNDTVPLVFITHEAERKNIDAALKEISSIDVVTEINSIILVEDFK